MPRFIGARCGREQHAGAPSDLLDLGRVPVVEQPVGGEVLVDGAERGGRLRRPAGAGHPAGGVDDDPGRLDQPGAARSGARASDGGGRGSSPGAATCVGADDLGRGTARAGRRRSRPAARARCAPRRTTAGRAPGPAAGSRRPGRRAWPTLPQQLGHDRLAGAVRQAEEHEVEPVARRRRRTASKVRSRVGGGQARVEVGDRGCRPACRRWPHARRGPGGCAQSRSSSAPGEPGRPDDADRGHRPSIRYDA